MGNFLVVITLLDTSNQTLILVVGLLIIIKRDYYMYFVIVRAVNICKVQLRSLTPSFHVLV